MDSARPGQRTASCCSQPLHTSPCGPEPLRSGPPQPSHSAQQQPSEVCWSGSACRRPTRQVLVGCCRLLVTVNCALDFRRHFKQEAPPRVSGPTRACAHRAPFLPSSSGWHTCATGLLTLPRPPPTEALRPPAGARCGPGGRPRQHGLGRAACAALPSRLALLGMNSTRLRREHEQVSGEEASLQREAALPQHASSRTGAQRLPPVDNVPMRRRQWGGPTFSYQAIQPVLSYTPHRPGRIES